MNSSRKYLRGGVAAGIFSVAFLSAGVIAPQAHSQDKTLTVDEIRSLIAPYDSRTAENSAFGGYSDNTYSLSSVAVNQADTPAHQHFAWVFRKVIDGYYVSNLENLKKDTAVIQDDFLQAALDGMVNDCLDTKIVPYNKADGIKRFPESKIDDDARGTVACVNHIDIRGEISRGNSRMRGVIAIFCERDTNHCISDPENILPPKEDTKQQSTSQDASAETTGNQ
jgi:hypothetical protein